MDRTLQRAFCGACWDGNTDMVRQLLGHPEVVPDADHSTALLHAAHRGHWRVVEMLMPVSNPLERNSEALWRAAKHRHGRVVRLLSPVSDTSAWEAWMWRELSATMARMVARHTSTNSEKGEEDFHAVEVNSPEGQHIS